MMTTADTERIPLWGLASASAAPVLLIGGWTLAALLQRDGFEQVSGTISALAARDADHRWVMTAALAATGIAHLITALALRPAARPGRVLLAVGGAATVLVAAAPLPGGEGSSPVHALAAGTAFVSLAVWPAFTARRPGGTEPAWPWRRLAGTVATGVLLVPLGWFFLELLGPDLVGGGEQLGLSERVAAGSQALWPLVAVIGSRVRRRL